MLKIIIALGTVSLLTGTAVAHRESVGAPSQQQQAAERVDRQIRIAQFPPPTGTTSSPEMQRPKPVAPPPKSRTFPPLTFDRWVVSGGMVRRRPLASYSAYLKLGGRSATVTGEISMELGGTYGTDPQLSDVTAHLYVTGGTPLVGKELQILIDGREVSRVMLPPYHGTGDSKQADPATADVQYRANLDPSALQRAKRVTANILIDGKPNIFYDDTLIETDRAIQHLLFAGGPPHFQRGPSAKLPKCTPQNMGAGPCTM